MKERQKCWIVKENPNGYPFVAETTLKFVGEYGYDKSVIYLSSDEAFKRLKELIKRRKREEK